MAQAVDQYRVKFSLDYPDRPLNRLTTFFRIITVAPIAVVISLRGSGALYSAPIPHYIILFFLGLAAVVVVIVSWFAIFVTGRYPRGLFDFVVGVQRWYNRVWAYAFILVTDRCPPVRLSA